MLLRLLLPWRSPYHHGAGIEVLLTWALRTSSVCFQSANVLELFHRLCPTIRTSERWREDGDADGFTGAHHDRRNMDFLTRTMVQSGRGLSLSGPSSADRHKQCPLRRNVVSDIHFSATRASYFLTVISTPAYRLPCPRVPSSKRRLLSSPTPQALV